MPFLNKQKTNIKPPDATYAIHRTSLAPLLPNASQDNLMESCRLIPRFGEERFLKFILAQGLGFLWHEQLQQTTLMELFPEDFRKRLLKARLAATGIQMLQECHQIESKKILDAADIPHVIIKGIHIRQLVYPIPELRPCSDIDLLVSPSDKLSAITALTTHGYHLAVDNNNLSHEISLRKGVVTVDLHWDILRPGRTRIPLTHKLLDTRIEYENHWGLTDEASLFLMLVHPVITKYATAPQASLIRVLDLAYWLEKKETNWEKTHDWMEIAGLKTAGWIMLEWLRVLTGITPPPTINDKLRPGNTRTRYLHWWMQRNASMDSQRRPTTLQAAQTLLIHDKFSDATHALFSLINRPRSNAIALEIYKLEQKIVTTQHLEK